jgi:hypothetical protein
MISGTYWIEDVIANWLSRVAKFQITSTKSQTNFKLQYSMTKTAIKPEKAIICKKPSQLQHTKGAL